MLARVIAPRDHVCQPSAHSLSLRWRRCALRRFTAHRRCDLLQEFRIDHPRYRRVDADLFFLGDLLEAREHGGGRLAIGRDQVEQPYCLGLHGGRLRPAARNCSATSGRI